MDRSDIDGRESVRYPTRIAGSLRFGSRTVPVTIDDLSELGAHVSTDDPLLLGTDTSVRLTACDLDMVAQVVRRTTKGYGLRFASTIAPLHVVRSNPWPSKRD